MTASEEVGSPVLSARGVRVELPAARSGLLRKRAQPIRALVAFDLQVQLGETVWIVGGRREAAQAIGMVLTGGLAPTVGTVELDGRDLSTMRGRRRARSRRQLVRLGADGDASLDPKRTALEVVAEAAAGSARSVTEDHRSRARALVEQMGLGASSCDARTAVLSEEERRIVEAARAVALAPRVVVYHRSGRPDAGGAGGVVWAALTGLRDEAATALVVVSAGLPDALAPGDRALILCGGRVVEVLGHGDLTHPLHPYTVTLRNAALGRAGEVPADTESPGPTAGSPDQGCPFRSGCPRPKARCTTEVPRLTRPLGATHDVACHFPEDPRRSTSGGTPDAPAASDEPTAREFAEG